MKDKNFINLDEQKGLEINPERHLPKLMAEVCEQAISELNAMFAQLLNEVDKAFFNLADQAESDQDQSLFFHSMAQLQNRRSNAEAKFSERLAKALIILLNTGLQVPLSRTQLNLTDEEKSRISSIIDKANSDNQAQMWQVTSRFDLLLTNVNLNLANNPLCPLSIINIFVETLALFDLQIKAKICFYDLFEQSLIKKLDLVYKNMNALLIQNGVLPNLTAFNQKPITSTIKSENSDSMAEHSDEANTDSGANLLQALTVLRKENPSLYQEYSSAAVAKVSVIENQQLVKALTKIQAEIPTTNHPSVLTNDELANPNNKVRNLLDNALVASNMGSSLLYDQNTDDIIACISMLFDFIINDNNLPNEFKTLIVKLQTPLLKVALLDSSFLTKGNHPARTLLNEFAQAGVGWSEGNGVGIRDKTEQVVNKIVEQFDHDVTLFTPLLLDFQSFSEQHKKRAFLIERRIQEAELGKARTESAKQKSKQAIDDIIDGKVLPEIIVQLLHEDWQKVLTLTFLRNGEDSEAWHRNLQTAKAIIDALNVSDDVKLNKATTQLSDLAENIKFGLDVVNYGEYESLKLFQELQQLYERAHQGETSKPPLQAVNSDHQDAIPSIESEVIPITEEINYANLPLPIEEEIDLSDAINDPFTRVVEALQAGNWFELQLKDKKVRCKLAAIINSANKFIFVGNSGNKIAEFTKPNLIQAFKQQHISQLEEGTLFDRALKSIEITKNQ